LDTKTALVALQDALNRCRKEDVRTPGVFAALEMISIIDRDRAAGV